MLDELGQKIISELQEDARQSFREIGRKLKISEGTVRNRVKNLVNSGAMKISAIPNPEKLGLNFMCVMCIEVKVGTAEKVEQLLIKSPNVYYLCGCTGSFDI
ncbi:MAG: Lrp/AsnC family transcriptional regulator, partial [Dehalococcoidales bacterium]